MKIIIKLFLHDKSIFNKKKHLTWYLVYKRLSSRECFKEVAFSFSFLYKIYFSVGFNFGSSWDYKIELGYIWKN